MFSSSKRYAGLSSTNYLKFEGIEKQSAWFVPLSIVCRQRCTYHCPHQSAGSTCNGRHQLPETLENFSKWLVPRPCTTPFTVSGTLQRLVCISLSNYTTSPINLRLARRIWHTHILHIRMHIVHHRQNVTSSLSNSHLNAMECMLCILNQLYQSFTCKKNDKFKVFTHTQLQCLPWLLLWYHAITRIKLFTSVKRLAQIAPKPS